MCAHAGFCFNRLMPGSYSLVPYGSFPEGRVWARQVTQSHFGCPWQPLAFAKLGPLHHSSLYLVSLYLPPFQFGSPAFITPPPPFVTNTTALSVSNPLETAWGSQYGANRFSAFTVELLRLQREQGSNYHGQQKNNKKNRIFILLLYLRQHYLFKAHTPL